MGGPRLAVVPGIGDQVEMLVREEDVHTLEAGAARADHGGAVAFLLQRSAQGWQGDVGVLTREHPEGVGRVDPEQEGDQGVGARRLVGIEAGESSGCCTIVVQIRRPSGIRDTEAPEVLGRDRLHDDHDHVPHAGPAGARGVRGSRDGSLALPGREKIIRPEASRHLRQDRVGVGVEHRAHQGDHRVLHLR